MTRTDGRGEQILLEAIAAIKPIAIIIPIGVVKPIAAAVVEAVGSIIIFICRCIKTVFCRAEGIRIGAVVGGEAVIGDHCVVSWLRCRAVGSTGRPRTSRAGRQCERIGHVVYLGLVEVGKVSCESNN